jgi:hypothetical protein
MTERITWRGHCQVPSGEVPGPLVRKLPTLRQAADIGGSPHQQARAAQSL